MKFNIVLLLISLSFNFLQTGLFAQPQLWEIYSTSNQPFVNVTVDKYQSDFLFIKSMDQLIVLHQDSIKYLLKRNESKFGPGFLIGAVLGGIFINTSNQDSDGLFSEIGRFSSTVFGILIGGVIGGLAGLAGGADSRYNIENLNIEKKRELLNRLFH